MSAEHSALVQSIAAVMGVIGLFFTLLVAFKALASTQRQAKSAQDQVEASLRPLLVFQILGNDVILKNVGNGPALNVRWTDQNGTRHGRTVFPMQDTVTVADHTTALVSASLNIPFEAKYESLSGTAWTVTAERDLEEKKEGLRLKITRL